MTTVGILHPGLMGSSIAAAAVAGGQRVLWSSADRSQSTAARAEAQRLEDARSLGQLCAQVDIMLSVCPPDNALDVAHAVAACDFRGTYVDCNAIASTTTQEVGRAVTAKGAEYVDGGIIGPPAWKAGTTRLYLCGDRAQQVAALFNGSALDARVIDGEIGAASALKMAYAGWTKGSAALLMTMYASALKQGVSEALVEEWAISLPQVFAQLDHSAVRNAPKAWRFTGEMQQIALSLEASGLPAGYFTAAHDTYQRLAEFKQGDNASTDTAQAMPITLHAVMEALLRPAD